MPWEISAHTAAAEKEKLWKWTENTSGAMGSRRERLPSETKRREEEKTKKQNKMAGSLALETSSKWTCFLSLSVIFFFTFNFLFFLWKIGDRGKRKDREEEKKCVK